MKKGIVVGLISGAVLAGVGVVSILLKHKSDKEAYGLDDYDFASPDFEDSDFGIMEEDEDISEDLDKDELVKLINSKGEDELLELGIIDKSSIDFSSMPLSVLLSLAKELGYCEA